MRDGETQPEQPSLTSISGEHEKVLWKNNQ